MAVAQILIERPRLRRWFGVNQFTDPLNCLQDESIYLRRALDLLEELAGNLHVAKRHERAASVLDYLSMDLSIHASDAEALIALLEAKTVWNGDILTVCDELREEHRAVQELLPAVTDGLVALANDRLPSPPPAFIVSALILAEFLRLHMEFEKNFVLTVAQSVLTDADLANLGRDMTYRRRLVPMQ